MPEEQKQPTRILFLLTQDLESPYGAGRFLPISRFLAQQGYAVSMAALHANFQDLRETRFLKEGVRMHYVGQMHVKKEANQTVYFSPGQLLVNTLKATWRLFRFVMSNPADVIVICKPHPMNSLAGIVGGWLRGARIILDCDDYEAASNYFSASWQRRLLRLFEDGMPRLAHRVTTNTHFNKNRMLDLGIPRSKIVYLPNGVDRERFTIQDTESIDRILSGLGWHANPIVGYIGSLSLANHPVDLLLRSFRILADRLPEARLLIVGGGKDLKPLQALATSLGIAEKTNFYGKVPPEDVPYFYRIASVTVDPVNPTDAARGRCPLKMFESWFSGTPFVTADVGDRRILAGDPPAALLAKPGDAADLADKLITVLTQPECAQPLIQQGRARIKTYNWQDLTGIVDNLIQELVQ